MRASALALVAAGLLGIGSVAWADDGNNSSVNIGGNGGKGGTAQSNSAAGNSMNTGGTATASGGTKAGDGGGVDQEPMCGPNDTAGGTGFFPFTLIGAGVNVPVCPAANAPVFSSSNGGNANGGTAVGGSTRNNAESASGTSADGGNGGNAGNSTSTHHKAKRKNRRHSH
jgi:CCR4-NOT transcription complex subunit 7/8